MFNNIEGIGTEMKNNPDRTREINEANRARGEEAKKQKHIHRNGQHGGRR